MKKNTFTFLLASTALVALYGCGGGGTEPPTTPVGDFVVPGNSKKDMGQLPTINTDEDDSTDNVLNLQALQNVGMNSDLSELKVCTHTECWTVLDNSGQTKSSFTNKKSTKITNRTNLIDIGSYDLNGVADEIIAIEYSYNSKGGETNLRTAIKTDQKLQKDLYLDLAENLSVPFSSISIENGRNGIFIPDEDFSKEFINGVIVEVENGSVDEMANLYITSTGKTFDDNFEANSYLLNFYTVSPDIEDISYVENEFPSEFTKDIRIYIPVNIRGNDPQFIKDEYILDVNASSIEFDIIERNSQFYFSFISKFSSLQILIFHKKNYGGQ